MDQLFERGSSLIRREDAITEVKKEDSEHRSIVEPSLDSPRMAFIKKNKYGLKEIRTELLGSTQEQIKRIISQDPGYLAETDRLRTQLSELSQGNKSKVMVRHE